MGQIKQGRRIRLRENLSVCFRMTGHLMKASPRFFVLNLLNAAVYAVSNPVQMLLYKKIIDLIVYSRVTLQTAAKYFALYYLLNQFLFVFHYLVDTNFNEREKIKINLYYKRFIYEETGRNRLEYCGDSAYMDRLYSAVHHDGSYLYRFAERLFSLVYSVISLCAVSYIFAGMHPVFPAAALVIAVRDFVLARRKNRTEYQRHTDSLPLERCKTYINNIFCLRDYVRELRMYPIGEYFRRKHRLVHELQWKINRKHQRRLAALEFAGQASDAACRIFNVAVGVALLRAERITVGELGMLFSRFTIMVQCIGDVLGFFPAVEDDARYMREIFETAEKEKQIFPEISPCGEDGEYIQFTGVSYRYHEKEYALSDINVRIPLGRKIAIVGENGSGKSTFVKLLAGLYEPTAGEIAWHCKNAGESCISLFGVMPQDFRIYAMSVAENIYPPFGEGDAGRVAEALDFCGMTGRVGALPAGIYSAVTREFDDGGVCFSGGEEQRLALARAYAARRPILLLDEPTGNLDAQTEQEIDGRLRRLGAEIKEQQTPAEREQDGRTVILVTHRLRTAQSAELVYCFEKGRLVESGTPQELERAGGKYCAMLRQEQENKKSGGSGSRKPKERRGDNWKKKTKSRRQKYWERTGQNRRLQ